MINTQDKAVGKLFRKGVFKVSPEPKPFKLKVRKGDRVLLEPWLTNPETPALHATVTEVWDSYSCLSSGHWIDQEGDVCFAGGRRHSVYHHASVYGIPHRPWYTLAAEWVMILVVSMCVVILSYYGYNFLGTLLLTLSSTTFPVLPVLTGILWGIGYWLLFLL
jgi:hypothetical protein